MPRKYEMDGPDELSLSVRETAKLFGYEVKSWRQLVREGRVPAPRGIGNTHYYTGLDVAIIREMMGRWQPQEWGGENVPKVPKSGRKGSESAEVGDSEDDD